MWEDEVHCFYSVSEERERLDLDQNDRLQRRPEVAGYPQSILGRCEALLQQTAWDDMDKTTTRWQAFLGRGNRNFWDYLVGVCLVSFHMSLLMFPPGLPGVNYATVRLDENPRLLAAAQNHSPAILADAVDTVALLWLAAWERWERMARGSR
jgi:hypothetical protein